MLDFKNAFNSLSRRKMLANMEKYCPEAMPWFTTCYGAYTPLYVGDTRILSRTGVQQGDPCGPAGFCWGVQDICEALREVVEWQAWYLDDATMIGTKAQLEEAIVMVNDMAAARGVHLNLSKCSVWGPEFEGGHPVDYTGPLQAVLVVAWAPNSGIRVLGVPVCYPGTDAFASNMWQARVDKVHRTLECWST